MIRSITFSVRNKLIAAFTLLSNVINKGEIRSVKAKKNILASFGIKGLSIGISLILVPITINYISTSQYGIWLTLSSIISWCSYFDIGFGNGLRNKFAEAVANEQDELARSYVSTTYAIMSVIIAIVLFLFFCINPYLNWADILNTSQSMAVELSSLALIVFVFFCLQFVFQLITTVLTANQEPAKASFFNLLGSILSLLIIFILTKTTSGNLIYLGFALSITPVIVLFASSLWFYNHAYKKYAPSIKYVELKYAKSLMSLGSKFFVIQIGALLLFETDNIIITQIFDPNHVTTFNVVYKLFAVIPMVFVIFMTPFWSAFTDAYTRGDYQWIKLIIFKMKKIWMLLSLLSLILIIISPFVVKIWLRGSVQVPLSLAFAMGLYVVGYTWLTLYCFLLNGIGKIKIQLVLYLFSIFINIPMAIFLGKVFGIAGVVLSNFIIFVIMGIILWIQSQKIFTNKATGIWNK